MWWPVPGKCIHFVNRNRTGNCHVKLISIQHAHIKSYYIIGTQRQIQSHRHHGASPNAKPPFWGQNWLPRLVCSPVKGSESPSIPGIDLNTGLNECHFERIPNTTFRGEVIIHTGAYFVSIYTEISSDLSMLDDAWSSSGMQNACANCWLVPSFGMSRRLFWKLPLKWTALGVSPFLHLLNGKWCNVKGKYTNYIKLRDYIEWTSIWWDIKVNQFSAITSMQTPSRKHQLKGSPTALKDGDARIASTVRVQPPKKCRESRCLMRVNFRTFIGWSCLRFNFYRCVCPSRNSTSKPFCFHSPMAKLHRSTFKVQALDLLLNPFVPRSCAKSTKWLMGGSEVNRNYWHFLKSFLRSTPTKAWKHPKPSRMALRNKS